MGNWGIMGYQDGIPEKKGFEGTHGSFGICCSQSILAPTPSFLNTKHYTLIYKPTQSLCFYQIFGNSKSVLVPITALELAPIPSSTCQRCTYFLVGNLQPVDKR